MLSPYQLYGNAAPDTFLTLFVRGTVQWKTTSIYLMFCLLILMSTRHTGVFCGPGCMPVCLCDLVQHSLNGELDVKIKHEL